MIIADMDMGDTLDEWSQPVKLKTLTQVMERFQPVRAVTVAEILAVVQPTSAETIAALNLDRAVRTYTIHSKTALATGQFFEYNGADFRIVQLLGYGDYGYYEAVGQDTREALLLPPPDPDEGVDDGA